MKEELKISKVSVYIENEKYYLSVESSNRDGVICIPRIQLDSLIFNIESEEWYHNKQIFSTLNNATATMKVEQASDGSYCYVQLNQPPVKEMTLKEIQEELGYKVKIKE